MTLDELQALADAATPGEWTARFDEFSGYDSMYGAWDIEAGIDTLATVDQQHYGQESCDYDWRDARAEANARFIASCRMEVPKLIARIRELEQKETECTNAS